jgi:voltage-gated potassium channel
MPSAAIPPPAARGAFPDLGIGRRAAPRPLRGSGRIARNKGTMAPRPRPTPRLRSTDLIAPGQAGEGNARANLRTALVLLALVTLLGTLGFVEIEGWEPWRAFYFTIVTITTVGYGDEGLSDAGKRFAVVVLLGGVTSASYTFATIVQTSIATQFAWRKRMNKDIDGLSGHTIVCGYGRLGRSICDRLEPRGVTFVVIERDRRNYEEAVRRGYLAIEGVASDEEVLLRAGLARAGHVVAAVDSFADNLVIALEAREANPEAVIIARAERDADRRKLERAGVHRVLCPFRAGGSEVVDTITRPKVADFLARATVGHDGIVLADLRIGQGSRLAGRVLADIGRSEGNRISFVALERADGEVILPPRGDHRLEVGDHLIVAGDDGQIAALDRDAAGDLAA